MKLIIVMWCCITVPMSALFIWLSWRSDWWLHIVLALMIVGNALRSLGTEVHRQQQEDRLDGVLRRPWSATFRSKVG